ncbi:MAG TPA: serine hydrolase domain-containing protein [Chitinophagaceae bacterium]|nr:serine hydrolase domain-containing protein [Chitinophagaceae bacterium]
MKTILLLLVLVLPFAGVAQSWEDTVRSIEKIFERYKSTGPGAQLAISRHGQVIFSKAWGLADLEHNVPLTTTSVTEAGSVSKQFTAAAILLLEQQGKLSLNDDVRKYVPELKDYGTPITLRQMMQHTSGLRDWGAIAAVAGWPRSTKTYNNNDALYIIALQQGLNNKPGAEYLYSNSNYNLFAVIVERVSGISLAEFTRRHIFEPAGMKHTQWRDNYKKVVPNRAIAYSKSGGDYLTNMPNEFVYGNGGLLTTAEDLLTWTHYYTTGKFGSPSLLPKQLETTPLNNGNRNGYAAGLSIGKANGLDVIAHDGATAGYRANLEHFPSLGLTIAWLSNTSEFDNAGSVVGQVRNLFIAPLSQQSPNHPAFTVTQEKLDSYAGWYRNSRTGGGIRLAINNGRLNATQVGALQPVGDRVFAVGNNRLELLPDHRRNGLLFVTAGKDSIYFTPVDSAKIDSKTQNEYVGEYYSAEAEARYIVYTKDGKLFVQLKPQAPIELRPTYKDGFDTFFGNVYFERDRRNKIVNFKVSSGRARNVEFKRIQ